MNFSLIIGSAREGKMQASTYYTPDQARRFTVEELLNGTQLIQTRDTAGNLQFMKYQPNPTIIDQDGARVRLMRPSDVTIAYQSVEGQLLQWPPTFHCSMYIWKPEQGVQSKFSMGNAALGGFPGQLDSLLTINNMQVERGSALTDSGILTLWPLNYFLDTSGQFPDIDTPAITGVFTWIGNNINLIPYAPLASLTVPISQTYGGHPHKPKNKKKGHFARLRK